MTSEATRIERTRPLPPRGTKVEVWLESGERLEVMLEAFEGSRLGVGDPLDPARRGLLLGLDADVRVREAALALLSHRARTKRELERRLGEKGFDADRVAACIERLAESGLVDDAAVAAAFVRDRLRHRPRGRRRLDDELRVRGVSREIAQSVIDQVFEAAEVTDEALAREAAEGWVARQGAALLAALASHERTPENVRARRRLDGYLARRGFSGDVLRSGVARAIEAAAEHASGPASEPEAEPRRPPTGRR